jgi:predicted small secreted protein
MVYGIPERWCGTCELISTMKATNQSSRKSSSTRFAALTVGALILIAAGMSTSCATTRGFGQDVEKTGDKIQEAAAR